MNEEIPVLILLSQESVDRDSRWIDLHEDYYGNVKVYEMDILDGTHYLHYNQAKGISESVNDFIKLNH